MTEEEKVAAAELAAKEAADAAAQEARDQEDADAEAKAKADADKEREKNNGETLEQKESRLARQLAQTRKKMGKSDEPTSKSDESGYGVKAFLVANGIKGANELEFAQKLQRETGKDYEALLDSTYFQTELKEFREKTATSNATPKGSKRANNSSTDTVEYWLAKGELPKGSDQKELRERIVNARMKGDKNKGTFYNS